MRIAALPKTLQSLVSEMGTQVSPQEVDVYGRLCEIRDKSAKLTTVLEAWERQQSEERTLRKTYAFALLGALGIQGALVNGAFFGIALGELQVDPWIARSFILAVFAEIAAMSFFIIKYLFPKDSSNLLKTVERL